VRPGFTSAGTFDPEVTYVVGDEEHRLSYRVERDGAVRVRRLNGGGAPNEDVWQVRLHGVAGEVLDLEVEGHRQRVRTTTRGQVHAVRTPAGRVLVGEHPRFPAATADEVAGATLAPMPGAIVTVAVTEGETVAEGALLCTVEAMKMEHRVTAPVAGTVTEVRVAPGQQVDGDEILVVVDAVEAEGEPDGPGA
jgi:propionyl-CoA carboxylase alpha chain